MTCLVVRGSDRVPRAPLVVREDVVRHEHPAGLHERDGRVGAAGDDVSWRRSDGT